MDDATILAHLPADQREAAVNQAEGKFWPAFLAKKEAEHTEFVRGYEMALTKAKVELGTLDGQREELTKLREQLALQLNRVERELAHVVSDYNKKANERLGLEKEYGQAEQEWLRQRENQINSMVRWFQDKRTGKATTQDPAGAGSTSNPTFLTNLVDADDQLIGPIYETEPWNQWVKAILHLPVKRNVKVRRGRKFTTDHLAAIYDHTEAKGVKWLSCMIQAIGEIQGKRCLSCNKNQGAFDDCIIIGTPLFQKCGNCEWNRQGCHGAALVADEENASAGAAREEGASKEVLDGSGANGISGHRDAPPQEDDDSKGGIGADTSREPPEQAERETASTTPLPYDPAKPVVQERRGLPTSRPTFPQNEQLLTPRDRPGPKAYPSTTGFTPANIPPGRPPSQDFETPTPRSLKSSPGASESIPHLPKITKDTLVLKHKDGVYTEPEIVAGVPLEKIDPSHPYWEPDWPNLEQLIEPLLAHCEDEHKVAMAKRGSKEDKATKRFQLGRQVNRGKEIIKFLEEGEISPFQLLSKKYTAYGKGSITSYDTLFRLCHALRELRHFQAKGKIDVEPVEWMRHRLHELWEEQGSEFKPAEAIRGFYHDPKMAQLREECGMKNIGRPRGSQAHHRSGATPADAQSAQKRRRQSFRSPSRNGDEYERSSMEFMTESGRNSTVPEPGPGSPASGGPVTKRARSLSPSIRPYRVTIDDPAEFTDKDVSSDTPLTQNDFRIDQIKSRLYTSSAGVTQYLHWIKDDRRLEHQTLKGGNPATWRALDEPISFDVRLDDLVEVVWNRRELKAHLVMSQRSTQISPHIGPRGDVMASFTRERTLKRLIRVLGGMGVRTLEGSPEEVQRRWTAMQSEILSDKDMELSSKESKRSAPSTAPQPVVW
ncbi:hypothetical protein BBK36DRAFT_1203955 [Trichoderma citrinoviride]|uniref:DUF3716 domain-containing protein n=1 Tax=Trichoderma citrinoviride TaxID=58853 RepID=A0A2T4B6S5_9HYPO|nr:hypothetical protein BBK36DRAFT_1203955 [Trichoderma citrinoviride]PTB65036.1 hypothetical protein BBK36DRAFT_1203955 [Trichoderma citrinoviride]